MATFTQEEIDFKPKVLDYPQKRIRFKRKIKE
jgi:hypothetical protein